MIVNPYLVAEGTQVLLALDLRMPITSCGGCLTNEIWLEVTNGK